jgi:hypothetical protein
MPRKPRPQIALSESKKLRERALRCRRLAVGVGAGNSQFATKLKQLETNTKLRPSKRMLEPKRSKAASVLSGIVTRQCRLRSRFVSCCTRGL